MKHLNWLDQFLSLWILLAMIGGTLIGIYTDVQPLAQVSVANVSLAVFIGLLLMLYPVFCKVSYETLGSISYAKALPLISFSIIVNWILCPLLMTGLAWATLFDLPHYRVGVILIGVARCIAMVLIWIDLANGDSQWGAILVAINSLLQMLLFAPAAYFYTTVIGNGTAGSIGIVLIVENVLIFLGVPLLAGLLTRLILRHVLLGQKRYDEVFIPWISPLALIGLLYTIIIMFALQGSRMVSQIYSVLRVIVPLILYFLITWFSTLYACYQMGFEYPIALTQSFTAASNNFELALAVAIAVFGVDSQEALAATVGPLIEVPVLLSLVYLARQLESTYVKPPVETLDLESTSVVIVNPSVQTIDH